MNRQGFLGGSDMYRIMRGDWYDLWLEKTGRKESEDLSDVFPVQLGVATEDFHLDWFEKVSGWKVTERGKKFSFNYKGIPLVATTDGWCEGDIVVECKHTSSFRKMDEMLNTYLPQLHHYMFTSNTGSIAFSVIFGNQHDWCRVEFNAEFWKICLDKAEEFWYWVDNNIAPPETNRSDIDWSQVRVDDLVIRDASQDNQFVSLAHEYVESKAHAAKFDAIKKELRSMIKDNEREVFCDVLSIKRSKNGSCRVVISKEDS